MAQRSEIATASSASIIFVRPPDSVRVSVFVNTSSFGASNSLVIRI